MVSILLCFFKLLDRISLHVQCLLVTMVIHLLRIKVLPEDRANAIRTIKTTIGPTKVKPGCLACSLYDHVDNDDELLLLEKWSSQKHLEEHIASTQYNLILEVIELAIEKPVTEFHTISTSTGMEFIEACRLGGVKSSMEQNSLSGTT